MGSQGRGQAGLGGRAKGLSICLGTRPRASQNSLEQIKELLQWVTGTRNSLALLGERPVWSCYRFKRNRVARRTKQPTEEHNASFSFLPQALGEQEALCSPAALG